MIRLVATDIDGTLLPASLQPSERLLALIAQVRTCGALVVPVTARAPRSTVPIARDLGLDGYAICGTGSLLYDLAAERVIVQRPLAAHVARRFVETMRVLAPGILFAAERNLIFTREPGFEAQVRQATIPEGDALEFADAAVTKLIARHPIMGLAELEAHMRAIAGDDAIVTSSGGDWVEVLHAGAGKAAALAELCARLGIDASEVAAFGDLPVDAPMLEWAGFGVAPANAHPDVRAIADEVTASCEDDGVADVLERLLAQGQIAPA